MEKIFLDTNIFIDIIENRDSFLRKSLSNKILKVSVASIGIWAYVYDVKVSSKHLNKLFEVFNFIEHTVELSRRALVGPTNDYEDNLQLHTAIFCDCDVFLTKDKKLLNLGYFGDMRIQDSI